MKPKIREKPRSKDGASRFYLRFKIPGYPIREVALKGATTKEAAEGLAATFITKIERGIDPFVADKLLPEWVELYFKSEAHDLRPNTIKNQRTVFRWWLADLARHHPKARAAKDVTPPIIRAYRNRMLNSFKMVACAEPPRHPKTGEHVTPAGVVKIGKQWKRPHPTDKVSPRTWNLVRSYLQTLFDFIARDLVDYDNPVRPVERATDTKKRRPRIREDYLMPLIEGLAADYTPRHALSFETMISCMLRPSEAANRKPADVDRFARVLWLSDTKNREEDSVPIPDDLLPRLIDLAGATKAEAYLFPSTNAMRSAVRKTCLALGIPAAALYSGRHTGISRALDNGALPHDVMRSARHKDFKTTQNYIHGSDAGKRRATNAASIRAHPPKKDVEVTPLKKPRT